MSLRERDDNRGDNRQATLSQLAEVIKRASALGIRVSIPASVIVYNPATRLASILAQFIPVRSGREEDEPQPPVEIIDVPVVFPGAGSSELTFPVPPGSTGLLVVCDRALGNWLDVGTPVDPVLSHTHNLGDSVFVPGLRALPGISPTDPTATVLKADLLKLGGEAATLGNARLTDPVTSAAGMTTWMAQISTAVSLMAAQFNGPTGQPLLALGPTSVPPPVPPTPPDFGIISGASTKVLSE